MLVSHWNIFAFHMHTCMKEFYYLIVDNKMSSSIQDTSRLCMISILMVCRKSGSPGVLWSPNISMTLKWSLLIFSVKISPVRCDAWTNKMSCAHTWCAGLNLFGFPKVILPLGFIHSLIFALVPTIDTTRASWILEQMVKIKRPVLLVGDSGTSKTATIHNFLKNLNADSVVSFMIQACMWTFVCLTWVWIAFLLFLGYFDH